MMVLAQIITCAIGQIGLSISDNGLKGTQPMKVFTLLLVTLGGPFEGQDVVTGHLFPSARACGEAMATFEAMNETHGGPEIAMMQCRPTGLLSSSPFPKPRPADLLARNAGAKQ
jgi:hypothetical protein